MTVFWNEKGERVSSFKSEGNKIWMIVEKDRDLVELHVIKTEDVFFSKVVETIRRGRSVDARTLTFEPKRYVLRQVPWREIAIRAIRGPLLGRP